MNQRYLTYLDKDLQVEVASYLSDIQNPNSPTFNQAFYDMLISTTESIQEASHVNDVAAKQIFYDAIHNNRASNVMNFGGNWANILKTVYASPIHQKELKNAIPMRYDAEIRQYASTKAVTINDGFYFEFGVFNGCSINFIANLNPSKTIYGFDSFEGLPENWHATEHMTQASGTYTQEGRLPDHTSLNVRLIKGLFSETLPLLNLGNKPIAFMHIDCDIYSATKSIFDALGNHIVPGTIILFDEIIPLGKSDEYQAFIEFIETRTDLNYQFIAYNQNGVQAAIEILANA